MNPFLANFWMFRQFGGAYKWKTLSHNGVIFPEEYTSHGIPVLYKNEEIFLDKNSEEMATLYAKYIDTEYVKSKIFNRNFWNDWKKILGKDHVIQNLEDCNFRLIYEYLILAKEKKKENAKVLKDEKKILEEKYKYAIVDGKIQPVGNFRIEPPGIFIGRGCNPKLGKIKKRIYPEDVTINIGKEADVPKPLPGHHWKEIIHDRSVEWLASWKDDITGKMKYVWLGAHSDQKSKNDKKKFDLARKLKKKIKNIREINDANLSSPDLYTRQIATALYFIDNFALRVGNEKGEDESDTVGVTSLRVEHITLNPPSDVILDFLGKDSIRYNRKLKVPEQVYQNLIEFTTGKSADTNLFDMINSSDVNKYLQNFMPELTAKVFRTFNASYLFQKELNKIYKKYDPSEVQNFTSDKIDLLLDEFNKANAKVALLCNHQKNVSKNINKQIDKINESIKKNKKTLMNLKKKNNQTPAALEKIRNTEKKIETLKRKKILKMELKNISLGTSKINYIDPRITVAFLKKYNIDVSKIFSSALQDKFKWAFEDNNKFFVF